MSVTATNAYTTATGNGSVKVFPFTFFAPDPSQVVVTINGVLQVAGFTTVTNPSAGGTVTFTSAPANGAAVVISLNAAFVQSVAFANAGAFNASAVDGALDQAAARSIFLNFLVGRSLKVPFNETDPGYPSAAARANCYLTHDGAGVPVPGISTAAVNGMLSDISTNALAISTEATARAAGDASLRLALSAAIYNGSVGVVALPRFTPEMFGATGGNSGLDAAGLAAAAAAINALGRGVLDLYPGRTYLVGNQSLNAPGPAAVAGATMRYAPDVPYPLEFNGCTGPVVVNMNGARIQCAAGKRYGTFNADTTAHVGQITDPAYAATPYFAMIYVHGCSGGVFIPPGGELDGNIASHTIGGGYDTTGIQFPMTGVLVGAGNTGPVRIHVNSHHHGLDAATIDANGALNQIDDIDVSGRFNNSGRQGVSLVGGVGVTLGRFGGIQIKGTGKDIGALTYSLPGAGVDLEAEGGKYVVSTKIYNPDIYDNSGPGILSSTNANVWGVDVYGGKIVGTTSWSHWLDNPYVRLHGTTVVGAFVNSYDSTDPGQAFQHIRGEITDDSALSPTGVIYGAGGGYLLGDNGGGTQNVLFDNVRWRKTNNGGHSQNGTPGVFSTGTGWRLHNCVVENLSTKNLVLYGIYSGDQTSILDANTMPGPEAGGLSLFEAGPALDSYTFRNTANGFAIAQARYPGNLDRLTGKRVYYGSATYDPPSLAAAAKTTIQTMTVTGVALGDKIEDVSFSVDLAGARIAAWVSAANTVSYYFINENGANPLDLASGTVRVKVRQA